MFRGGSKLTVVGSSVSAKVEGARTEEVRSQIAKEIEEAVRV